MTPVQQRVDPIGRPASARSTCAIGVTRTAPNTGSVWPTRDGSDQAALDIGVEEFALVETPLEVIVDRLQQREGGSPWWDGSWHQAERLIVAERAHAEHVTRSRGKRLLRIDGAAPSGHALLQKHLAEEDPAG